LPHLAQSVFLDGCPAPDAVGPSFTDTPRDAPVGPLPSWIYRDVAAPPGLGLRQRAFGADSASAERYRWPAAGLLGRAPSELPGISFSIGLEQRFFEICLTRLSWSFCTLWAKLLALLRGARRRRRPRPLPSVSRSLLHRVRGRTLRIATRPSSRGCSRTLTSSARGGVWAPSVSSGTTRRMMLASRCPGFSPTSDSLNPPSAMQLDRRTCHTGRPRWIRFVACGGGTSSTSWFSVVIGRRSSRRRRGRSRRRSWRVRLRIGR